MTRHSYLLLFSTWRKGGKREGEGRSALHTRLHLISDSATWWFWLLLLFCPPNLSFLIFSLRFFRPRKDRRRLPADRGMEDLPFCSQYVCVVSAHFLRFFVGSRSLRSDHIFLLTLGQTMTRILGMPLLPPTPSHARERRGNGSYQTNCSFRSWGLH